MNKPASAVTNLPSARIRGICEMAAPPVSKTTYENKHSSVPEGEGGPVRLAREMAREWPVEMGP